MFARICRGDSGSAPSIRMCPRSDVIRIEGTDAFACLDSDAEAQLASRSLNTDDRQHRGRAVKFTVRGRAIALSTVVLAFTAACSRGTRSIETDPRALAAVHADVRVVAGETTLVAHGQGYELVARSRGEIARVQPELDRDAAALERVFPTDSVASIVVTVRHATPPGKPYVAAPHTPSETRAPVVDVVLPDPNAKDDERNRRGGLFTRSDVLPAERAWLSAHASEVTRKPAPRTAAKGEAEDTRVPAWAEDVIPSLTADSLVDRVTTELAAHADALIPLSQFFTMERPTFAGVPTGQRGEGRPSGGGSTGRGGMGGGMGGRGGMGGMRGGTGRGGMGGGGGQGRSQANRESMPLMGGALFEAQSIALGHYLVSREGYDFIGTLMDAQLTSVPIDSVLAKRNTLTVPQMDADFRRWLVDRAAALSR